MSLVEYLLIGFVAFSVIGGLITFAAFRGAADGCEDVFGFHVDAPQLSSQPRPASAAPVRAAFQDQGQGVTATVAGSGHPFIPQTSTDTSAPFAPGPVQTTVRGSEATVSPLFRRQHRSTQSHSPFAAGSASPFPTSGSASPFDAARVPAGPANSNSPFEVIPGQKPPTRQDSAST